MLLGDLVRAVEPGEGLAQPQHGLELPDGDPPGALGAAAGVPLAEVLVLLHQQVLGVHRQLRLEHPRKVQISEDERYI